MASSVSGTLVAATVTTTAAVTPNKTPVNVREIRTGFIEVFNSSGSAEIWFTTDGTAPTVGGTACYYLPAVVGAPLSVPANVPVVVKLISSGTPTFVVRGG